MARRRGHYHTRPHHKTSAQIAAARRNLIAARAKERHLPRTNKQSAASRRNVIKAEAVARTLKRSPAQIAAAKRNLARARAASHKPRTAAQIAASRRNIAIAREHRAQQATAKHRKIATSKPKLAKARIHFQHRYVLGTRKGTLKFGKQMGMGVRLHLWGYTPTKAYTARRAMIRFRRPKYKKPGSRRA